MSWVEVLSAFVSFCLAISGWVLESGSNASVSYLISEIFKPFFGDYNNLSNLCKGFCFCQIWIIKFALLNRGFRTFSLFYFSGWPATWRFFRHLPASSVSGLSAHLVWEVRIQRPICCGKETEGTCRRPRQTAYPDLPWGHMYQQHICHAVQERNIWSGRNYLSCRHQG